MKIQSTLVICGAAPAIEPHNGAAAALAAVLAGAASIPKHSAVPSAAVPASVRLRLPATAR